MFENAADLVLELRDLEISDIDGTGGLRPAPSWPTCRLAADAPSEPGPVPTGPCRDASPSRSTKLARRKPTRRHAAARAPLELAHDGRRHLFHDGPRDVLVRRRLGEPEPVEPPVRVLLVSPRPEDGYVDHRACAVPLADAFEALGGLAPS